jgi:hypothetical protein
MLQGDGVRLFVGLPQDTVSHDCNSINHSRAIAAGLKALKLLGVEGVELPIWWGIVEKEAMGKYDWSGYLAIAEMIQKVGLKLHVSLCFHGSKKPNIPLPKWVSEIGESDSSIFFTDRSGQHYKECLSLAVDNLPVLDGKTPVQVYQSFCESFKSSFSPFMESTITVRILDHRTNYKGLITMTYLSLSTDKLVFVNVFGRAYENNLTCLYDVFSLFS